MAFPAFAAPTWIPAEANLVSELPTRADRGFLMSIDDASVTALPLAGSGRIAFPSDGDPPALVPLPPPAWAGLGLLGALAYARHKNRRRSRA
jgi:hypothetical protein